MLVSTGEAAKKYPGAIHLSETARFIWERVDTMSREEIAEAMLTEFEIDLPTAQRDVTRNALAFLPRCTGTKQSHHRLMYGNSSLNINHQNYGSAESRGEGHSFL